LPTLPMFNLLFCFRCSFRKLEAYATTESTARVVCDRTTGKLVVHNKDQDASTGKD